MQRPRTTYKFSPELAALLEALLRQGHVVRSDATARVSSGQTTQQVRRKKEIGDTVPKTRAEGRQRAAEKAWERREQRRKSGKTIDLESSERAIAEATKPTGYTKLADFFHQFGEAAMTDALIMSGIVNPIRTAFSVVGGALGGNAVDKTMLNLTKSDEKPEGQTWSEWVNDKLGLRQGHMVGQFSNPGILLGGTVGYKTPGTINTGFKYALETVPIVARNYRLSTAIDKAVDNTKLPFGNNNYTTVLSTLKTSPDTGAMVLYQRPQSKLSLAERIGVNVQDRDVWNPQVMNNAREFARKYGYEEPNSILDAKDMYRLHNRFFRTVNTNKFIPSGKGYHEYSHLYKPGMTELEVINAEFPEFIGMTPEQIKMQLASKGYPRYSRSYYKKDIGSGFSDDFVFVSPSLAENMDYAGNTLSNTILLQRPFSFGKPSEWHINADWRPSGKIYKRAHNKGEVSEGNSYFNHEAKVSTDHLIPVKIAETGDKGTLLGEFLNNKGLLNNETQPVLFINLEETFTPATRQFVHPSEAVRKAYTAPNLERLDITTTEPLMSASKGATGVSITQKPVGDNKALVELEEVRPKFNYRQATIPELAGYILEDDNAVVTHPNLTRTVAGDPEIQRYVENLKTGEETVPIYTYPNGRQVSLIESATGENVSLGTMIVAKEAGIETPHVVTLTGIRPILKENGAITEESGLEDFVTRNGFNFSTNSRANATEYAWLGDARENILRLTALGFGKGKLYDYYTRLHKIIDDLNKKYGVKNYAYPNTVNTDKLPLYRATGKPVNFSLQTHLSKKPNGTKVDWDPTDRAVYDEAMDLLSQFWGENLNGGGVRETLIPRGVGLNVGSTKPMDYRNLSKHDYVMNSREHGHLPENIKNMDMLEEWAKANGIQSFQVGPINDPLPSISRANKKGTFWFAKKHGGKLFKYHK